MTSYKKTAEELAEHEEIENRLQWYHRAERDKQLAAAEKSKSTADKVSSSSTSSTDLKQETKSLKRTAVCDDDDNCSDDDDEDDGDGSRKVSGQQEPIEYFLAQFEHELKKNEVLMCTRELVCKCKVKKDCNCDSEAYSNTISAKGEMGSSCRFSIEVCMRGKLEVKDGFKKILRFFYCPPINSLPPPILSSSSTPVLVSPAVESTKTLVKVPTETKPTTASGFVFSSSIVTNDDDDSEDDNDADAERVLFDIVPTLKKTDDDILPLEILIHPFIGKGKKPEKSESRRFPITDFRFRASVMDVTFNYLMELD